MGGFFKKIWGALILKFAEKKWGLFKIFGEGNTKKEATGIEPVTSPSQHQQLNHLRPWVFFDYTFFCIPLIDYLFY